MFEIIDPREHVNICSVCPLFLNHSPISFVPFEIVGNNPQVMLIAESPYISEIKEGRPLIGLSGQLLRQFIEPLLSNYILGNVVLCHPNPSNEIHTPSREESDHCKAHFEFILKQYDIQLIVILGKVAATSLIPNIKKQTAIAKLIQESPFIINKKTYIVDYHPSFILRNGGIGSREHSKWCTRIRRYIHNFIDIRDNTEKFEIKNEEDLQWKIHQPQDIGKICSFLNSIPNEIGLDFEARTTNTWEIQNVPTGFSLVFLTGEKSGRGFFVSFEERQFTLEEQKIFIEFLEKNKHRIWAYNEKYESGMIWSRWGKYIQLQDSYILTKIDSRPQGLKDNAQFYFNQDIQWENLVEKFTNLYKSLFAEMSKLDKTDRDMVQYLKRGNLEKFVDETIKDKSREKKCGNVIVLMEKIKQLSSEEELIRGITMYPYEFAAVPLNVLAQYCCYDSYYTLKLHRLLINKIPNKI